MNFLCKNCKHIEYGCGNRAYCVKDTDIENVNPEDAACNWFCLNNNTNNNDNSSRLPKKLNSEIWHCLNDNENLPNDGDNIVFIYENNYNDNKTHYGITKGKYYEWLENSNKDNNGFTGFPYCSTPKEQCNYPLAWAYLEDIINDLFEK